MEFLGEMNVRRLFSSIQKLQQDLTSHLMKIRNSSRVLEEPITSIKNSVFYNLTTQTPKVNFIGH